MWKSIVAVLLFLAVSVPTLAQGTYTQIDVPGSGGTFPFGVNSAGHISGTYYDPSSRLRGFLLTDVGYTFFDCPFGVNTIPRGLNDLDQIVGVSDSTGFLFDSVVQTFTPVIYPGAPFTEPFSINNAGTIVGIFAKSGASSPQSFELSHAKYTRINPLKSPSSAVYGISDAGKVVGYAAFSRGIRKFLFHNGEYKLLPIPDAPNAIPYGINRAGTVIVGEYQNPQGVQFGFVYQNNVVTTLQFPGSSVTTAFSINDAGQVVGWFNDSSGTHGFIWTPPADPVKE